MLQSYRIYLDIDVSCFLITNKERDVNKNTRNACKLVNL